MSDLDFPGPVTIDQQSLRANGYGMVQFGRSKYEGKLVEFYWNKVHNPAKSREMGIPFYDKEIFVRISTPGERLEEIDRPMRDQDRFEFPQQWSAFENNRKFVPEGTPIKAAEAGTVAYAGNEVKGFGNLVMVRHADGWVSVYANASEIKVKRGDIIKRGQVIALSGQSGDVSAPQLHFELRKGSVPVDPVEHLSED